MIITIITNIRIQIKWGNIEYKIIMMITLAIIINFRHRQFSSLHRNLCRAKGSDNGKARAVYRRDDQEEVQRWPEAHPHDWRSSKYRHPTWNSMRIQNPFGPLRCDATTGGRKLEALQQPWRSRSRSRLLHRHSRWSSSLSTQVQGQKRKALSPILRH